MKAIRAFVLAVVLVLLSASLLMAQSSQGRILGTITDASGAVVSDATVTVTNTATGISRTTTTSKAGEYVVPQLDAGPYSVKVQSKGFATIDRTGLQLEVAKDVRVDVQLKPGAETQVLEVSGEAPIINTTNDVLGETFSNEAINELPLQGRDFQNLAILQPGIQREPGGGFLSITANGNRPEENNFVVDGIDDNDAYYGTTVINAEGVQGTPATILPIDAIQEFNIQSSPEADYGWKPGAIINVGIKSGTNTFHGSTYYFNRNNAVDARNWFNPAIPGDPVDSRVSAINLHQFGASAGGPILHDKLFIFANDEGVRSKVGNPVQVNAPVSVPIGDPTSSIADAMAECSPNCSPLSVALANYLPYNPGPDITMATDFNNLNREDNGIAKLDYTFSQKHSFSVDYFIGDSLQTEEDVNVLNPMFLSQAKTRAQVIGGAWVWAPNNRLTNQFHIGYNRFWQQVYVADHNLDPASVGINTGVTNPRDFGLPEIRISGFTNHTIGGNGSWPLYTTPNQTLQFTDTASYLRGRHYLRFGGEVRTGSTDNVRDTYGPGYVRFSGTDELSALENFVFGNTNYGYVAVGDSHRYVNQTSIGGFAQDAWHMRPNFTLNLGLRYDVTFPIHERHDQLANFDPSLGMIQVGKQISSPYNTDYKNLAPRVAFDWDLFGNGKTVLRAGAGIIYEIPHISVFIGQNNTEAQGLALIPTGLPLTDINGNPIPSPGNITATTRAFGDFDPELYNNWQAGGPIFGDLSPGAVVCSYVPEEGTYNPCPVFGVNHNIKTPFVTNWNVNLERTLWQDAGLTVAYVGTKGNRLYSVRDINQNSYANDSQGDEQSGRPLLNQYPYLSFIDMLGNGDNSVYHSLQVTLKQRTHKGLYFIAGYTWAHSIDDSSSNRSFNIQDSNNPGAERGNSDFDIRHRFTFATTYQFPSHPGYGQWLQGWGINSILTAQSGEPLFFYDDGDDISYSGEFTDRWNFTGNPRDLHWSKTTPIPWIPDGSTDPACLATATTPGLLANLEYYGCYHQGSAIMTPPEDGTFGNMGRNIARGPAYFDWDFSVIKNFKWHDRLRLEARAEFFDILNHPNFSGIDTDLYDETTVGLAYYTTDIAASNPVVGSGGARHIQFGLKFIW